MTAPVGDHVTVIRTRAQVPLRGKENMTVQKHVKFIRSIRVLRRASGRQLFVGAREAGLFVDSNALVLKSSTPSAYYHQVLSRTGLALSEQVVPWRVWVLLVKLPEFLQTTY